MRDEIEKILKDAGIDDGVELYFNLDADVEWRKSVSQAILQLFLDAVGEDEPEHFASTKNPANMGKNNLKAQTRNQLRQELREKVGK